MYTIRIAFDEVAQQPLAWLFPVDSKSGAAHRLRGWSDLDELATQHRVRAADVRWSVEALEWVGTHWTPRPRSAPGA